MGKNFEFKIDVKGLKNLDKQLVKEIQRQMSAFFESFGRRYRGRPVDQVRSALAREFKQKLDGTMTDAELTECAAAVSNGETITVV